MTQQAALTDPEALVRVRYREADQFVGALWGLYFERDNLSEPVYRAFAQMAVHRSGLGDSHRILEIVEIDQDTKEPLADQPTREEALESARPQVIDLGQRREEIERRRQPDPDRGVPTLADIERAAPQPAADLRPQLPPVAVASPRLAAILDDEEPTAPTRDLMSEVAPDLVRTPPAAPSLPQPAPQIPPDDKRKPGRPRPRV
jgi:hypothetical protein